MNCCEDDDTRLSGSNLVFTRSRKIPVSLLKPPFLQASRPLFSKGYDQWDSESQFSLQQAYILNLDYRRDVLQMPRFFTEGIRRILPSHGYVSPSKATVVYWVLRLTVVCPQHIRLEHQGRLHD